MNPDIFAFDISKKSVTDILFSDISENKVLKGNYVFVVNTYDTNSQSKIIDSRIILGGKAFGLMGTDE